MSDVVTASLTPVLVSEMLSKVKGHSTIAKLCASAPIPFNGMKEFTFSMDREIDVVAESGAKTKGGVTTTPITVVPVKVEYGARISDEFMYSTEEVQLDYLSQFADGWAKKLSKGIDIMSLHGFNPRTGVASTVIGTNHFDTVTNIVTQSSGVTVDANIEAAIALVNATDNDCTGIALSPAMRSALAALTITGGAKMYPELSWGSNPGVINGMPADTNSTVSFNSSLDRAIVGDFANCFRWGFAKEMPIEIIQYGNPDNDSTLGDLKGHNQIYLRGEAYVGWAILNPDAFAIVKAAA